MGRKCCINNCGRTNQPKKTKGVGVESISLFKAPVCPQLLQKWVDSMNQPINPSSFVCDIHFAPEDLKRDYRTTVQGKLEVLPFSRPSLKKGAIPRLEGTAPSMEEINAHHHAQMSFDKKSESDDCNMLDSASSNISTNVVLCKDQTAIEQTPIDACFMNEDENIDIITEDEPMSINDVPVAVDCSGFSQDDSDDDLQYHQSQKITCSPTKLQIETGPYVHCDQETTGDPFNFNDLVESFQTSPMPEKWSWYQSNNNTIILPYWNPKSKHSIFYLEVHADLSITVMNTKTNVMLHSNVIVESLPHLYSVMESVIKFDFCEGTGFSEKSYGYPEDCRGILFDDEKLKRRREVIRCKVCRDSRAKVKLQMRKDKECCEKFMSRNTSLKEEKLKMAKKVRYLVKQNETMKNKMHDYHEQCASIEQSTVEAMIQTLEVEQQETVRACFKAAKAANSKGRRYTIEWVYECLLMRIKSPKLYKYLQEKNKLPLPCVDTLNHYIKNLNSAYGFNDEIFECLRVRGLDMETNDKRGTLLVDEMALSEGLKLNRKTMKMEGFVELGEHTPENLQNVRADHALVFMFQPFRGQWVQVVGSFLSKNAVTGEILYKLLLECIILLENAGYHVDCVTADGAQWNRKVWSLFGITTDNVKCDHPCDPSRHLYFCSDFPHLVKCLRNKLVEQEEFWTPDGVVKKIHFETLLRAEGFAKMGLKCAYKLTQHHLKPVGFQKMNVPLAFELFSKQVRVGMKLYENDELYPELKDSHSTISFLERVDNLITAMTSRNPKHALKTKEMCSQKEAIQNFIDYLNKWSDEGQQAKEADHIKRGKYFYFPITDTTYQGLLVTLKATLELTKDLGKLGFHYLLTSRLTQDALERFFGMMRNACGCNDHPDPSQFQDIYRLLCCYSLIKPPRGSNVEGTDLLQSIMTFKKPDGESSGKTKWTCQIHEGVESSRLDCNAREHFNDCDVDNPEVFSHLSQHDYDIPSTTEQVMTYIAGFVASNRHLLSKCGDCIESLWTPFENKDHEQMIAHMNPKTLTCPSDSLRILINQLESCVLKVVGVTSLQSDTMFKVLENITWDSLSAVGCCDHQKQLTEKIITKFLLMRAEFLAKTMNQAMDEKRMKTKMNRKNAKLY